MSISFLARVAVLALGCSAALALGTACGAFSAAGGTNAEPDASDAGNASDAGGSDVAIPPHACDTSKTASDGQHCGRCDHSCLGGACAAGTCQPFTIAQGGPTPVVDVALDATRVLWTTAMGPWIGPGGVFSCPRSGCAGAPPVALVAETEGRQPGTLASDGMTAYVSLLYGSAEIARVDKKLTPIPALKHGEAVRLQVRAGILYFAALGEGDSGGTFPTRAMRWDGTTETEVGAGVDVNLFDFAATDKRVFLASTNDGLIHTCEVGGACTTFRSEPKYLAGIATDGERLYWATVSVNAVYACPVSQTPCNALDVETVLGAAQLGQSSIKMVNFERGLLLVTTSANEIFACNPKNKGCDTAKPIVTAGTLYDGNEHLFGRNLTSDDEALYWSETDPGATAGVSLGHRIMKLAR